MRHHVADAGSPESSRTASRRPGRCSLGPNGAAGIVSVRRTSFSTTGPGRIRTLLKPARQRPVSHELHANVRQLPPKSAT